MSIVYAIAVLVLAILLQRWLHRHIQGFALLLTGNPGCAVRLLFYLLLPGIILHEASHLIAAKLVFVRAGGINLGIGRAGKKQISLGSVSIERSDPVRTSVIGVAPFLVGVGAICLIAGAAFGMWPQTNPTLDVMLRRVMGYSHNWTTWLAVYLIFAVSTAMIPSESDREPWGAVVAVVGVGIAALLLLGWSPSVPVQWVLLARQGLDALTFGLSIAVLINGGVAVLLWLMERIVSQFNGRYVGYRVRRRE